MSDNIKTCHPCKTTLAADYQDKVYGKNVRVHTHTNPKPGVKTRYCCTVCGATRE